MSVSARITAIHLIEKMEQNDTYCEKLGLSVSTSLRGERIDKAKNGHRCCKPDCN